MQIQKTFPFVGKSKDLCLQSLMNGIYFSKLVRLEVKKEVKTSKAGVQIPRRKGSLGSVINRSLMCWQSRAIFFQPK